jgi:hypothetical protein
MRDLRKRLDRLEQRCPSLDTEIQSLMAELLNAGMGRQELERIIDGVKSCQH